jgi:hypothetical protein
MVGNNKVTTTTTTTTTMCFVCIKEKKVSIVWAILLSWPPCSPSVYMFDKVFASFSLLTRKNLHKKKMHVN